MSALLPAAGHSRLVFDDTDGQQRVQLATTQHATELKRVHLAVEGGAAITIDGGRIEVVCPGTITVHASKKRFVGPARMNADHPAFPKSSFKLPLRINFNHAPQGLGSGWAGMPYRLFADGALVGEGVVDEAGSLQIEHPVITQEYRVELANGARYVIPVVQAYSNPPEGEAANLGFLRHEPGIAAETDGVSAPGTARQSYSRGLKGDHGGKQ